MRVVPRQGREIFPYREYFRVVRFSRTSLRIRIRPRISRRMFCRGSDGVHCGTPATREPFVCIGKILRLDTRTSCRTFDTVQNRSSAKVAAGIVGNSRNRIYRTQTQIKGNRHRTLSTTKTYAENRRRDSHRRLWERTLLWSLDLTKQRLLTPFLNLGKELIAPCWYYRRGVVKAKP